jgi:hypothetical protein
MDFGFVGLIVVLAVLSMGLIGLCQAVMGGES